MIRKRFISICTMLLCLYLLQACQNKIHETQETLVELDQFDSNQYNHHFYQKGPAKQWAFVYEILKNKPIHNEIVETWINNKLPQLFKNKQQLTERLLRDINDEVYHSDFYELQYTIAQFTIDYFGSDKYIFTHATAAMILASHYNFYKQKDSLAKYVNKLDKSIEHDTASWLKLGLYTLKANLAILKGDYFEAVVNYHKAIEITKPSDFKNLSTLYQNLAEMYLQIEYLDKAYTYSQKALGLVGLENFGIENLITYGVIQYKFGMLDSAEITYNQVISKAIKSNLKGILAQVYSNYSNLKNKQGLYNQAHHYLNLSDSICVEMNIEIGLYINLINRMELWLKEGDFESLFKTIPIAESKAQLLNNDHLNIELYKTISSIYEKSENETMADKYYAKYNKLKEKNKGDITMSVIAEWELSMENKKLLTANAQYAMAIENQKNKKYQISLILSLLLLVISSLYISNLKRNRIKQKKIDLQRRQIENELESKSKELLSDSIKNISIRQTKDWVNKELNHIIQQLPRVHHHHFEKLTNRLKNNHKDSFLDEFDMRFTGVYESFYEKLKKVGPDLTPNEIRICAMIKLNISSKEIAMLSNRTIGTVENIRSSIRKKLQLPNNANLQDYLLHL